ncbi:class I SAM-dependent methyltransferase [Bdellovibrio sp. qaytius]|nr:class I SAM-dependent methyltransferase [Bdellovibrio sp. qaytius]
MNYLTIDERGDLYLDKSETAVPYGEIAQELLRNVRLTNNFNLETSFEKTKYLIEAFDHPLFAFRVFAENKKIFIEAQQDLIFEADLKKFSLDPFDRICGLTTSGAPFRLTEKTQSNLFDECDEFDDDSFTLAGIKIDTPEYYFENPNLSDSEFWTDIYNEGNPGWDLGEPAVAFKDMIQRIKLPKSRILVLGCGAGHDAALFAEAGHVVTAVDFSEGAIKKAKSLYSHLENLTFVQQDIFALPHDWNETFDVIVEHTCFCAIDPDRRKEMVKLWRRLLHEEGQIMGVFFAMLKRAGPPYGSSEWEIRELLKNSFHFLFWGRWRESIPRREGRELFVLAKKRKA